MTKKSPIKQILLPLLVVFANGFPGDSAGPGAAHPARACQAALTAGSSRRPYSRTTR